MVSQQIGVSVQEKIRFLPNHGKTLTLPVFIGFAAREYIERANEQLQLAYIDDFSSFDLGGSHAMPWSLDVNEGGLLYYSVRNFFDQGGVACHVLFIPLPSERALCNLVDTLCQALQSNLLQGTLSSHVICVPDIALLSMCDEDHHGSEEFSKKLVQGWRDVWLCILGVCSQHVGCFAVLDLPRPMEWAKMFIEQAIPVELAQYGATYWPHLYVPYLPELVLPPSASIAAAIQRTDRERGSWKAPANIALSYVLRPEFSYSSTRDFFLKQPHVNQLRSFPGRGVVIWGARTLHTVDGQPHGYVPVRRLLSYIERNISELSSFCVYEPNNEITWIKLRSRCRMWLRKLWLAGGLFGSEEEQAFRIFIGLGETMTDVDLVEGRLILRIEVAAMYPAEFIEVELQISMNGANV